MKRVAIGIGIAGGCLLVVLFAKWFFGARQDEIPVAKPGPLVDFEETKVKAERGDSGAQNTLGDLYANGRGVTQDYTLAVKWYRQAAHQGHAAAQYNLGTLYASGIGVPRNPAEAAKWYRQSAGQGNLDAQYNLAQMLSMGAGVPRDLAEALKWYRQAAEQGDALSQFNLARRYREGKDVAVDPVEAYKWFMLAAAQGIRDAAKMRDELKHEMTRDQMAEAERRASALATKR